MGNTSLFVKIFIGSIVVILFSACNIRRQHSLFNAPTDLVVDTIKQVYVVNDQGPNNAYKIQPGDRLVIRNFQDIEFGATKTSNSSANIISGNVESLPSFQVDNQGDVKIPSVDDKVRVGGLTRSEATQKIQDVLVKNGLADPIIEVTITNLKVTLLGEFAKQGNFFLARDNTTLIDIIGDAGGLSKEADPRTLKIIRGNLTNPEITYVDLTDINSLASKKLILQNNDIITVMQQKSYAASNKLQNINNFIQPILVLLNLGLLIFTITK